MTVSAVDHRSIGSYVFLSSIVAVALMLKLISSRQFRRLTSSVWMLASCWVFGFDCIINLFVVMRIVESSLESFICYNSVKCRDFFTDWGW